MADTSITPQGTDPSFLGSDLSAFSNDQSWSNLPQEYRNQILSLAHTYETNIGFAFEVTPQMIVDMATKEHVNTLSDMGQFVWGKMDSHQRQQMPWAGVGLDKETYQQKLDAYSTAWLQLTGEPLDMSYEDFFLTGQGGGNPQFDRVLQALGRGVSASQWVAGLKNDSAIQKQYGWVKFGMDFAGFQQYKMSLAQAMPEVSDQQAVLQLQYRHQNSGGSVAPMRPQQQQNQGPAAPTGGVVR